MNLRTGRGMSAKIVEEQGIFKIKLYSNGEWGYACCLNNFKTDVEALMYFNENKKYIHS